MRWACLFTVLLSANAAGDVIHVPLDQPTIEAATDVAGPGDQIIVAPGTYPGGDNLSVGGYSIVSSGGSEVTIIDGGGIRWGWNNADRADLIEGFTFQNCNKALGGAAQTVRNCVFQNNSSVNPGGAVEIYGATGISSHTFENCIFRSNSTTSVSAGAVFIGGNPLPTIFTGCLFESNSAPVKGGAVRVHESASPLRFVDCSFRGNSSEFGGAVYINSYFDYSAISEAEFINCVFERNAAERVGGAVHVFSSDPKFINCAFWGNDAPIAGESIFAEEFSLPLVMNSIFDNSGADGYAPIDDALSLTTIIFSNTGGAWGNPTSHSNITGNPQLVDPNNGDFRLTESSPCVDRGFNWALPEDANDFDMDGNPRFADLAIEPDDGCGAPVQIDMGPFEYQGVPGFPQRPEMNGDGVVNVTDLLDLLSEWGECHSCCEGDFDASNDVNVTDLLALLAGWG